MKSKDYGSWRDIGTSIGHFGICSGMIIGQLLLFGVAELLLKGITIKEHQV